MDGTTCKIENVFSAFDGMSCGQIALNRAGIKYKNYFASEIDKPAMRVTQHNYPGTIQLGDITKISAKDLPKIDLLMGGSPCQDFSAGNRDKKGLGGERSGLFWDFIRLKNELNPRYFLLENVIMQEKWMEIITKEMGVKPVEINSGLVSAQRRRRLYWTNIPMVGMPNDIGITISDIIYDDTYKNFTDDRIGITRRTTKNYVQWDSSGKGYGSQQDRAYFKDGKMCTLPKNRSSNKLNIVMDYTKNIYRRMHPVEAERCQNVPDNYTNMEGVATDKRFEMLGNGWTVDVIVHILKGLHNNKKQMELW